MSNYNGVLDNVNKYFDILFVKLVRKMLSRIKLMRRILFTMSLQFHILLVAQDLHKCSNFIYRMILVLLRCRKCNFVSVQVLIIRP